MVVLGRWGVMAVVVLAGVVGGCGGSGESAPATTRATVEVTEMRGVIEKMPTAEAPRRLMIRHEATQGMGAMTMPFVVAEGVSLAGFKEGDKVAFRQEVNLTAGTELVTRMEKLPAETELKLEGSAGGTMPGM